MVNLKPVTNLSCRGGGNDQGDFAFLDKLDTWYSLWLERAHDLEIKQRREVWLKACTYSEEQFNESKEKTVIDQLMGKHGIGTNVLIGKRLHDHVTSAIALLSPDSDRTKGDSI